VADNKDSLISKMDVRSWVDVSDIAEHCALKNGTAEKLAKKIIDDAIDYIFAVALSHKLVYLDKLGAIKRRDYKARSYITPKTGTTPQLAPAGMRLVLDATTQSKKYL
jgi:nucleoid DNA-binding protein